MVLDEVTRDRVHDMVDLCGLDDAQPGAYLAVEARVLGPGSEGAVALAAGVPVSVVREGLELVPENLRPPADI